ncbi:MAG: hypothetical protein GC171_08960 [Terrimonas sp.]|nr:hypothetical protein [Terrimonas sp.]
MDILSHRGYWLAPEEKNTVLAFERSFSEGFGVETDLRDSGRKILVSHDMPAGDELPIADFLEIYKGYGNPLPLALNVKSDGLQQAMSLLLKQHGISNYFFFDMSLPDALGYCKNDLSFFTRQSEYEEHPYLYDEADGVWLDEFKGHWITDETITAHIRNGKKVCIVSPELHKRKYMAEWEHYRYIMNKFGLEGVMLCTDYPAAAKNFFNL